MAFWAKIKQFFGAGTVKVHLEVPSDIARATRTLPGKITLAAVSDQDILDVTVSLKEVWQKGKGEDRVMKEFELGKIKVAENFAMKTGDSRVFDFQLPFDPVNSRNDDLKEHGGAVGALGKMGSFLDGEKSNYWVTATADVRGAAFDPNATKEIKLT